MAVYLQLRQHEGSLTCDSSRREGTKESAKPRSSAGGGRKPAKICSSGTNVHAGPDTLPLIEEEVWTHSGSFRCDLPCSNHGLTVPHSEHHSLDNHWATEVRSARRPHSHASQLKSFFALSTVSTDSLWATWLRMSRRTIFP